MGKEEKKGKEGPIFKVFYIGKDISYFKLIKGKFKSLYPDINFTFISHFEEEKARIKIIAYQLSVERPDVIFLDFSVHTHSIIRLGMGLKREFTHRETAIIGLLDNIDSREILSLILSLGLGLNIVKGIDLTSVIYNSLHLTKPDKCLPHAMATAEIEHPTKAMSKIKIGYFTEKYLHIECNYNFKENEIIKLKTKIFPEITFPSNFKVIRSGDDGLFGPYDRWYDLEYFYLNIEEKEKIEKKLSQKKEELKKSPKDINTPQDINDLEIRLKKLKNESEKSQRINQDFISSWIRHHKSDSGAKRASILIFDREMTILHESIDPIDSYKYSIRQQAYLPDHLALIGRLKSGILMFQLDPLPEDSEEKIPYTNTIDALKSLVKEVSKQKDYVPIIIVFNWSEDLEELKKELSYSKIIFRKEKISFQKVDEIATTYLKNEGRKKTHTDPALVSDQDNRFYISKYLPFSIAEITHPISVVTISEIDIVFKSEEKIPDGAALYLKDPAKMTMTLAPFPSSSKFKDKKNHYYALISGVGEVEKNKLRQHINKLFFTELDKKKREEVEEFKKKNAEAKSKKL